MRAKHCTKRTIVRALQEVQDGESMYSVKGENMDSATKQCGVYRTPLRSRIKKSGGEKYQNSVVEKLYFAWKPREKWMRLQTERQN